MRNKHVLVSCGGNGFQINSVWRKELVSPCKVVKTKKKGIKLSACEWWSNGPVLKDSLSMKLRLLFTAALHACLILIHNRALTRYQIHFEEYF